MNAPVLPESFYIRPTLDVARDLLGKLFVRMQDGVRLSGRIVEVEAYHGETDEASHAFGGRRPRNEVMFGSGGRLYVYFTYGMHFCMNVVTEDPGVAAAVLIRALEPVEGIPVMRRNRGDHIPVERLTSGPARACRALGIDRALNGASLQGPDVMLLDAPAIPDAGVYRSRRIGISKNVDPEWRFAVSGSSFLSRR